MAMAAATLKGLKGMKGRAPVGASVSMSKSVITRHFSESGQNLAKTAFYDWHKSQGGKMVSRWLLTHFVVGWMNMLT
jgi:hypothetical protein